ncbi:MAG TPA: DUF4190 domain-containing protein [Pyrinomonadaceae bacterium]|nr:DUF4190 domain-containing protein [Pyrinomonadaceae bacterium]
MSETVRRLKINKRYEGSPCKWCGDLLLLGEDGAICASCESPYHARCWDRENGCNNPGCVNRPLQQLKDVPPVGAPAKPTRPLSPGEMVCPTCGDVVSGSYCFRCRNLNATDYSGPKETLPEAKEALKYAIIGIFCFGIVLGPMAIVKGTSAKKTIAMDPRYEGEGMATAAQIIGGLVTLLYFLNIVFLIGGIASGDR